MTLREALLAANRPGSPYRLQLCCGFEPLHLVPFLKAHLNSRLNSAGGGEPRAAAITTGLFGDLLGNVERALALDATPIAVVLEWADIDPRLGMREAYRPSETDEASILEDTASRLAQLQAILIPSATSRRIVLALPAAPLPPWLPALPGQASSFTLQLRSLQCTFAAQCALGGIRIAETMPAPAYDIRSHLQHGFPYLTSYTDRLAAGLAGLLVPGIPKKGLVTDLDNTVWLGIVGDDGPAEVHWDLEHQARIQGLYQQFLAGLAAQGVLLAAASKNDPGPVAEALARQDLMFPASILFPVEANWGPKSESLRRIAAAWNIGLDAIVFVDDNPLELAEVQQALPEVECHLFPASDPAAVLALLETLRLRFGREKATEEDLLRAASLRGAAQLADTAQSITNPEELLAGLGSKLSFSFARQAFDARSLELLNKTNQFNLNGLRWQESDFREFLKREDSLLCVTSYEDRFGPLGKIAVATAIREGSTLRLRSWVMSCRAFSRRIEFETLRALFDQSHADQLILEWQSTPRNGPTRTALEMLLGELPQEGALSLTRAAFDKHCPSLFATAQTSE